MTNDMTNGNPTKLILSFSIPLLIGNIFQQLYSIVDMLIVGRTINVQALAAVGATGAISFLIIGFVIGMTSGFSVITAQCFGANDYDGVRHSVAMSTLLCVFFTIILTIISVLTARPLLLLMNTPADILDNSYNFIIVIYYGIAASVFYNMLSCIMRALGDSKTPLLFLIIASVLNIILVFVFILCFHMGVAGSALATVISQAISGILCLFYISKKFPILKLKKSDWTLDFSLISQQLKVGMPMAFQFSITAIGVMVLQTALNAFGSTTVAAFASAAKIENLVTQLFPALGTTMATYTAQNYGAGKYERIRSGVRRCTLIALIFSIAGGLILILFGGALSKMFVGDAEPMIIEQAKMYLNTIAIFLFPLGILFILRNTLQGMGKSTFPLLAGVAELILRVLAAVFLSLLIGYRGVCFASPIAWVGATVLLMLAYFFMIKKSPEFYRDNN